MTGILNHPKMPVVAGSLALALLAGGIYSSLDEGIPGVSAIKKVDSAVKSAVTLTKSPAQPLPATPAPTVSVPTSVASAALAATSAQPAPQPVVEPAPQVHPVAAPAASESHLESIALAPKAVTSPTHRQAENAPGRAAPGVLIPQAATPQARVQPIAPVLANTAPQQPAAVQPVVVNVSPVARVTLPDEVEASRAPVAVPTSAPAVAASPAVPVKKPVKQTEKKLKKHKMHVIQQGDADSGSGDSAESGSQGKVTPAAKPTATDGDYTEIKGAASSQTLAPAPVRAQAAASVAQASAQTYKPTFVAASGGQAWVKISPERTIAVKSGDSIPGFGKVTGVNDTSVETEKGKLSKE